MPVIARFYGIIIRMYFQQAEHTPPHIHALYGEDVASVDVRNGTILEGHLPPKAMSMVKEWIGIHQVSFCKCGRHRSSSHCLLLNKEKKNVS